MPELKSEKGTDKRKKEKASSPISIKVVYGEKALADCMALAIRIHMGGQ